MHACSATINLFTDVDHSFQKKFKAIIVKYEKKLIDQLLSLMRSASVRVKQEAVTAFAAATDMLGAKRKYHFQVEKIQIMIFKPNILCST